LKATTPRSKAKSNDSDAPSVNKRGRRSKANEPEASDADTTGPNRKKAKINGRQSTTNAGAKSKQGDENGEDEDEDRSHNPELMLRYMDEPSWEHLIKTIETVEGTADNKLLVYFFTKDGKKGITETKVLRQRAPQMLIDFYESNLRWKPKDADENAADSAEEVPAEAASVTAV